MNNPAREIDSGTDRDLQDDVIRYLTDASLRSRPMKALDQEQVSLAKRFSSFLARRYYRDRLVRGFRHSKFVAPQLPVERLVDGPEFDAILDTCVLGSFATSQAVADLALASLQSVHQHSPWCKELFEYDRCLFIQLATSELTEAREHPCKGISAILQTFSFRMSELIAALGRSEIVKSDFSGEITLLFSRTAHGKIYVVEPDAATVAVFDACDGNTSTGEIALSSGLAGVELQRILTSLAEIGSVVLPST